MSQGETHQIGFRQRMASLAVFACVTAMFFGASANANTFFDFSTDPLGPQGGPPAGFTPAPFLNDGNAAAVSAYLSGQPVKAVKVITPLNGATISTVYGTNAVKYTFADFEGISALANTVTLRNQIAGGPGPLPANVYVGNYDFYPIVSDSTRAPGYTPIGYSNYLSTGVNIASESLYPGSWMFRTKTDNLGTTQSNAPSIRSALFTLPIARMSFVQAALPAGHKHIPYVNRFNNWNNALLNDAPDAQYQFKWTNPTGDQMISRGDFKAMVAHYRLRGADGVHLLDGGVVGYSTPDFQADAMAGWNIPQINSIFAGGGAKIATLDTTARVGGNLLSSEEAGMVFSGVYSLTQNGGQGKLALLVSNMVDATRTLQITSKIGNKLVPGTLTIPGGHSLLEFTGAGTQWQLVQSTLLFTSTIETDRSGVGVPEPTMMGGVALLALFGLARRRRN